MNFDGSIKPTLTRDYRRVDDMKDNLDKETVNEAKLRIQKLESNSTSSSLWDLFKKEAIALFI